MNVQRQIGEVKRWKGEKGFGFIRGDQGDDLFFLARNVRKNEPREWIDMQEGQRVRFDVDQDDLGRPCAIDIERI